jgi:hypothetical protein
MIHEARRRAPRVLPTGGKLLAISPSVTPASLFNSSRSASSKTSFKVALTACSMEHPGISLVRTVTPSIATSIVPEKGPSRRCARVLDCRGAAVSHGAASTTAGTNRRSSPDAAASASRTRRRQPNNCSGDNPCWRATLETESPRRSISATMRALSSSLHVRLRPAPVNTCSRRTGLVIALSTVSILSLAVREDRKVAGQDIYRKVGSDDAYALTQLPDKKVGYARGLSGLSAKPGNPLGALLLPAASTPDKRTRRCLPPA